MCYTKKEQFKLLLFSFGITHIIFTRETMASFYKNISGNGLLWWRPLPVILCNGLQVILLQRCKCFVSKICKHLVFCLNSFLQGIIFVHVLRTRTIFLKITFSNQIIILIKKSPAIVVNNYSDQINNKLIVQLNHTCTLYVIMKQFLIWILNIIWQSDFVLFLQSDNFLKKKIE